MIRLLGGLVALAIAGLFLPFDLRLGPVVLRAFDVLLVIVVVIYLGAIACSTRVRLGHRSALTNQPVFPLLLIYVGYLTVSGFVLTDAATGFKALVQNAEVILLFLLLVRIFEDSRARRLFVFILVTALTLIAVVTAGWHLATGHFFNFKLLGDPKLTFGIVAVAAFVYRMASEWDVEGIGGSLYASGALMLMLLSGERKGWIAFLVAIMGLYLLLKWHGVISERDRPQFYASSVVRAGVLAAGLLVSTYAAVQIPFIQSQVSSLLEVPNYLANPNEIDYSTIQSPSNRVRIFLVAFTLESVRENPVFGVGTDRFKAVAERMAAAHSEIEAKGAHSEYQRMAVENGMIGLVLYVLLWWLVVRGASEIVADSPHRRRPEILFIVAMSFYGLTVNFFLGGGVINRVFLLLPAAAIVGLASEASWFEASDPDSRSVAGGAQ